MIAETSLLLGFIFSLLALLHFGWALGMKWGFDASLPTNEEGERVLNPKTRDSIIVGIGLALFAIFYSARSQNISLAPNATIDSIISWIIPSIFLLRAIGDFRYLGFFKKIKHSKFGKTDTRLVIPLCLLIAFLGFYLVIG